MKRQTAWILLSIALLPSCRRAPTGPTQNPFLFGQPATVAPPGTGQAAPFSNQAPYYQGGAPSGAPMQQVPSPNSGPLPQTMPGTIPGGNGASGGFQSPPPAGSGTRGFTPQPGGAGSQSAPGGGVPPQGSGHRSSWTESDSDARFASRGGSAAVAGEAVYLDDELRVAERDRHFAPTSERAIRVPVDDEPLVPRGRTAVVAASHAENLPPESLAASPTVSDRLAAMGVPSVTEQRPATGNPQFQAQGQPRSRGAQSRSTSPQANAAPRRIAPARVGSLRAARSSPAVTNFPRGATGATSASPTLHREGQEYAPGTHPSVNSMPRHLAVGSAAPRVGIPARGHAQPVEITDLPARGSLQSRATGAIRRNGFAEIGATTERRIVHDRAVGPVAHSEERGTRPRSGSPIPMQPRARFGYQSEYRWLAGRLEYSQATGQWKLRYIPIDGDTDRYGGSVAIANLQAVEGLEPGQYVRVEGNIVAGSEASPEYAPQYRIARVSEL